MNRTMMKTAEQFVEGDEKQETAVEFICECSDADCQKPILVSIPTFEQILKQKNRFLIKPGHDQSDIEEVVERQNGYHIVEKHASLI